MAVPDQTVLTTPTYSASVTIASRPVPIYSPTLRFESKTSTTYIEAQPGVEFRVEYSSLRPKGQRAETDIAVALDVDGVRMGMQRAVRCFDVDVGEQRVAKFEGHRTSSTTIQPFVFKSLSSLAAALRRRRARLSSSSTASRLRASICSPSSSRLRLLLRSVRREQQRKRSISSTPGSTTVTRLARLLSLYMFRGPSWCRGV
ncbi:hypothetical protein BCR35DRAFT_95668 [Leucosporidium creatinivorum]|uniref:DUF7918 domain-containing protein n=1 Tax=Leucosporidium creatinivorum TaxID=106004 RepID=A0A1Y2F7C7_9BASI|nr:hypothetical protein BCR35DRAFT_95668 [Leucosporidium creatinivorum]